LEALANARALSSADVTSLPSSAHCLLHADYRHGYLHPG
jgi:hypothetical protein